MAASDTGATTFRLGYRPALDGIRGFAVVAVVLSHLHSFPVSQGVGLGVVVFFVLSGFLISVLLIEEHESTGRIDLRSFYMRRALRLLPGLYAMLLVLFALVVVASFGLVPGQEAKPLHDVGWILAFPAAALYVFIWVIAFGLVPPGALEHTWTLAVEEQFYLLWAPALLLLLGSGMSKFWLAGLVAAVGVAFKLESLLLPLTGGTTVNSYRFDAQMLYLLIGCATGLLATAGLFGSLSLFARRLLRVIGPLAAITILLLWPSRRFQARAAFWRVWL